MLNLKYSNLWNKKKRELFLSNPEAVGIACNTR